MLCSQDGRAAGAAPELERLLSEAAGHPLFLSELAHFADADHQLPVTTSLKEAIWQRVNQLDDSARRFMECVALVGAPMKFQVVARAARIEVADSLQVMSALRIGQMVRVERHGETRLVEPYHDRVREAVVDHFEADAGERRAQLHLAIGRCLLDATPEESLDDELFTIVWHLQRGASLIASTGERHHLVSLTLRAARKAKLATAFAAALDYVATAEAHLDKEVPHDLRFAILKEYIEIEYLVGHSESALQRFEVALGEH
jgi:predicted ATPase